MADRLGIETIGAFTRSAATGFRVWPPAVVPVTQILPLLGESVASRANRRGQSLETPDTGMSRGSHLGTTVVGQNALQGTYNGIEHIWAMALGRMPYSVGGIVRPVEIVPGAYRHTYEIDATYQSHAWRLNDGVLLDNGVVLDQQQIRHGVMAVDKGQDVIWENNGATIGSLQFRSTVQNDVQLGLEWVAHQQDRESVVNTDLSLLTCPIWKYPRHQDLTLRIGPQSDTTPLDNTHDVDVSACSVRLTNRLTVRQLQDTDLRIGEPRRNGYPIVRGQMAVPRWPDNRLVDASDSDTLMMASMVFVGPQIGTTGINYEMAIYLPSLYLDETKIPTRGSRIYNQGFSLDVHVPTVAAAGMPTTIELSPIIVELVTDSATHPLY